MESSPESAITQTFNPYVQSAPVYGMGVDSLIYEPLMDFNLANPAKPPYYMLATAYKLGRGWQVDHLHDPSGREVRRRLDDERRPTSPSASACCRSTPT